VSYQQLSVGDLVDIIEHASYVFEFLLWCAMQYLAMLFLDWKSLWMTRLDLFKRQIMLVDDVLDLAENKRICDHLI
jgi:hypothetical protein